jgi:hypothetical protein
MTQNKSPLNSKVIDGFVRTKQAATQLHTKTIRSKTLMRNAVAKPVSSSKPNVSTSKNINQIDREGRASKIVKNTHVQRFGGFVSSVKPKALEGEVVNRSNHSSLQTSAGAAVAMPPLPSMITSVSHQNLERMLDEALVKADSHKQAMRRQISSKNPLKRIRYMSRWITLSAAVFAVLSVGGFLAYQKLPQVAIKLAASRAHIRASVPGYKPSGFNVAGPINYAQGAVTIHYKSALSNQAFTLVQKQSNLDSTAVASTVVPTNSTVQTSQVGGNTVYIYGAGNDAAWVNNGVLYTIKNNASLPSDQLIKIVQSL